MFTGLIEDVGVLAARIALGNAGKLEVKTNLPLGEVKVGESICVNGACLTVEEAHPRSRSLIFHTLAETLRHTNLSSKAVGRLVNLERSLRFGDRLGGHMVSGHIDTTSRLLRIEQTHDDWVITVQLPDALQPLVVPKGSIAVDGISLTVAEIDSQTFTAHIIPHTWQVTNLRAAVVGDVVNLEADLVGKYILRHREIGRTQDLSMAQLERAGFGG